MPQTPTPKSHNVLNGNQGVTVNHKTHNIHFHIQTKPRDQGKKEPDIYKMKIRGKTDDSQLSTRHTYIQKPKIQSHNHKEKHTTTNNKYIQSQKNKHTKPISLNLSQLHLCFLKVMTHIKLTTSFHHPLLSGKSTNVKIKMRNYN